jgi:hypothetical protein
MAYGKLVMQVGPTALTTTLTTNVYNQGSALIYDKIEHVHVVNKTASAATFSLWIGATGANAAGTEWFNAQSVPAFSVYDWFGLEKLISTQFIVGGAGTTTALTITIAGEQFVV